jgi:hypothetical protein
LSGEIFSKKMNERKRVLWKGKEANLHLKETSTLYVALSFDVGFRGSAFECKIRVKPILTDLTAPNSETRIKVKDLL